MNYRQYENFEYQNAVAQDLRNWAIKFALSKFIVASVPQQDRTQVEAICDGVTGTLDLINPPKTREGQALAFGTNTYNLSKYL
jgi:hypothetical protein